MAVMGVTRRSLCGSKIAVYQFASFNIKAMAVEIHINAVNLEAAMDLLLPLLSSMFLFIMVGEANHPSLEPQVYWRTILPNTPMPSAIAQLLQPDVYNKNTDTSVTAGKNGVNVNTGKDTTVSVGNDGVNVNTGKGTTVDVGHGGVNVNTGKSKPGGTTVGVGKGGVDVHTGKGTSVNVGHGGVGVQTGPNHKPGGTTVNVGKGGVGVVVKPKGKPVVVHVSPFVYNYAASDDQFLARYMTL
ncbi:BURP domain-containing protein 3-like [Phalaenopsis equestris]|uniref:BURP domain-containing protein 3-like n=1 Tax=Phalaenopsis equestris TaxID=78828 RepID=UPI0009E2C56E|nr:BURP domain-containing protein 3-like [Phalaenopsis equestris]